MKILIITLTALTVLASSVLAQTQSDAEVKAAIMTSFEADPTVLSDNISVSVTDGIVTLDGSVRDLLERRRAADLVTSRKGVRSLINTLTIATGPRADEEIQADTVEALAADQATTDQAIKVGVQGGVVLLQGEVDYFGLKEVADMVVAQVYGARGIDNQLRVKISEDHNDSDDALASHLDKRFRSDVWLNDLLISIAVTDGKVILTGTVDSIDQLNRAMALAWVPGVKEVNITGLTVEPGVRDQSRRDPTEPIADEAVESAIEDALKLHSWINSGDVKVEVEEGVVTLSGEVAGLRAKLSATSLAQDTVGAKEVNNQLVVETSVTIPDETLRESILAALRRNTYTYRSEIEVSSDQGAIGLFGMVENPFIKDQAGVVAAGVYGVKEINNELKTTETFESSDQ